MSSRSRCRIWGAPPSFVCAVIFAALGTLSLTIALSSSYWLVSKSGSNSSFLRLGLFNVCLRKYQYHSQQYDIYLDGCYSMFGHKSPHFREWLLPGWFISVQCLTTCAAVIAALCICLLAYMVMQKEAEIKIFVAVFVFVSQALSALLSFLGICVFGGMSFDRSWIQYPKLNSLSWGFGFAVAGSIQLGLAAGFLVLRTFQMRKKLFRQNVAYHIPHSNRI